MANTSSNNKKSSVLESVDVYGAPIEIRYKGMSKFNTSFGGVMTIFSYLIFAFCLYYKLFQYGNDGEHDHDGFNGNRRMLESNKDIEQFSDFDYHSDKNIRFNEAVVENVKLENYTEPMNLFENGIKKITVLFNQADDRELIEKLEVQDDGSNEEIRKVGTAERKAQIKAQYGAFNKYLIFKLTTTYVPGDGPDAKQVDDLEGFTRVQYLNKDDLILEEGEDDYTIFPKMDILKDISIMGDYHSQNYSNMKAYTKLELKADFYEIQKQALNKTDFWLEGITNMTTSTVSKYNCSAALARAPTYHE